MAKIKVKNVVVGMRLSEDVCDPNGRFLLGKDCTLTDKHLKALNAWGVISVVIIDEDMTEEQVNNTVSPEIYNTIEEQVKIRFQHNNMEHPFVCELITESIDFFVERLSE